MNPRLPQRSNDEYQLGSPSLNRRKLLQTSPDSTLPLSNNAANSASSISLKYATAVNSKPSVIPNGSIFNAMYSSTGLSRHNSMADTHGVLNATQSTTNTSHAATSEACPPCSATMSPITNLNSPSNTVPLVTAPIHPPLDQLDRVDKYVLEEPSNIVHLLPSIASFLEHMCISNPESCNQIWSTLKPLLENLQDKERATKQCHITRPPSPICEPKPYSFQNVHGENWHDDFGWLNDRSNQQVLDYIEAENQYSEKILEDTKPLQKLLYREFVSRLDESQESAKVVLADGWSYYSKKIPGKEYNVHCRVNNQGVEEVYFDENVLANSDEYKNASFFRVGFLKHSPDGWLIAYGIDSSGNERYTVSFMVVETKKVFSDQIKDAYEDFEFSHDGSCAYYTVLDGCERAYQLRRHCIGTLVSNDVILYDEADEMFYLSLTTTSNGNYIILNSSAQITSEVRYISAHDNNDLPHLLFARQENIQYICDSHQDYFYILTNENGKNNWLYRIPIVSNLKTDTATLEDLRSQREPVIEHRDFVLIEDFQLRQNHLIVFERSNCLPNVRIVDITTPGFSNYHYIGFSEVVYSLLPGSLDEEVANLTKISQFTTNILRFTYTSFVQPKQVIDYDMDKRTMSVVHEEKVGGLAGYDQNAYSSRRLFATGVDGTAIPISIVFRRDLLGMNMNPPQLNPVLLHSYGAYGSPTNPVFSSSRLSLLDRGFIYAIAHIRGGADMGNGWYEEGKLAKKPNTFYDFCSAGEHLIKEGYTDSSKLAIYGRSAGGLLVSAAVTMRPDLFEAALTEVPFVDVINTMFDSTIPWTAFEYEEWGNPNDKEIYNVMKTYCPYTNVNGERLADFQCPHLLVIGGMNDPRVAFFEPLKWVAKMRNERRKVLAARKAVQLTAEIVDSPNCNHSLSPNHNITGSDDSNLSHTSAGNIHTTLSQTGISNLQGCRDSSRLVASNVQKSKNERMLLLRIDDAGHGGNSGQYSYLEDLAFKYAFLISTLGASTKPFHVGNAGAIPFETTLSPVCIHDDEPGRGQIMMVQGDMLLEQAAYAKIELASSKGDGTCTDKLEDKERRISECNIREGRRGRGNKDDDDKGAHRTNPKNDRGQRRLFQWVHNWF
ncbi:hypothetical protein BDV3_003684 [Batrachochytrium dendrobatidis]|uniref:Prolyl endopeptidase-like n=1 Tax=Batrachochytrium dendrobatidis (strain JEL423) TaxID=403673 RepID=A0A177WEY0_BATDL|nr:hypothetical protein O5D80_002241 [Batrachochytrium dendrobatidis]KAK5669572.1 hypothetical protein QVD99_003963 [Batrachochytrium dendrobatidis]OAJ38100.1 hypothetical protein BDEG_22060 [Batrachochytrium dendrobatidis JEL423]